MDESAIVEYEREREKWNLDPTESATATGTNSGCGILLGLIIGLTVLIMVCLFFIK
jgi:tetrahydromethanopterin S-methyltransferase subunit G